jgi:hypothetical protein
MLVNSFKCKHVVLCDLHEVCIQTCVFVLCDPKGSRPVECVVCVVSGGVIQLGLIILCSITP